MPVSTACEASIARSPYEPELCIAAISGEKGEDPKELEAKMIAGKIREIVGKLPVRDSESGQLRPGAVSGYRDFAADDIRLGRDV